MRVCLSVGGQPSGGACGFGRQEAQPLRLCPVEVCQAWGAHLGVPLGPGPTRVAHRVQCHDQEADGPCD